MSLLDLVQAHLGDRLQQKTPHEWAGPCPGCGGDDRFVVTAKNGREVYYCRGCEHSGDELSFLRLLGRTCREGHEELGRKCTSTTCHAERCRARDGDLPRPPRRPRALRPPARPAAAPEFRPTAAATPQDKWRARAEKLIAEAHEALLAASEPLAYLAARGLPREAVERYRFGWLAEDRYRPYIAWGLPAPLRDDGKPKKMWLPAGILIPSFAATDHPIRLRIRRARVEPGRPRYYQVPGSGNDVVVLGPEARGFVVVESDLDAHAVHHAAGDLVGAIPLGTAALKPKEGAAQVLARALCILVATDFEPRENAKTGRPENPGGKAALWWSQHYPRARRWPVPAGKDPGDYVEKHAGDLRAWVLAGLPPVFRLPARAPAAEKKPAPEEPAYVRGVSQGGIPYVVAPDPRALARAREENPNAAAFLREELVHLRGKSPEELHAVLLAKLTFEGSRVVHPSEAEPAARRPGVR